MRHERLHRAHVVDFRPDSAEHIEATLAVKRTANGAGSLARLHKGAGNRSEVALEYFSQHRASIVFCDADPQIKRTFPTPARAMYFESACETELDQSERSSESLAQELSKATVDDVHALLRFLKIGVGALL